MTHDITDLTAYRDRRDEDWDLVIEVNDVEPSTPQQFSVAEIQTMLGPEEFELVESWLARGDSVAVYRNHDRSHHDLGRLQFKSFVGEAPERPFDGADESYLIGICAPSGDSRADEQ
jgi:hypothetical protein